MTFEEWWKSNGIEMATYAEKSAARKGWEAGSKQERERICSAIKEEDDFTITNSNYMLDSNDCIAVAKGTWNRLDHIARQGKMKITAADALLALKAMPRRRHAAKAIAAQLGTDSRAIATALRGPVNDGRVSIKYRDGIGRYKFHRLSLKPAA